MHLPIHRLRSRATFLLLLSLSASPALLGAETKPSTAQSTKPGDASTSPTEVVILGTIHGAHSKNRHYPAERVKKIVLALKPAAILAELPLKVVGKPTMRGERIAQWVNEGADGPEIKVINPAADALHVPVFPFDRPDRNDYYQKTKYFDRQKKMTAALTAWQAKTFSAKTPPSLDQRILQQYEDISHGLLSLAVMAEPDVLNSEGTDAGVRIKHNLSSQIFPEILKKYPELEPWTEELHFFANEWDERNQIMADNIRRIVARYPGRRLVVLVGAEHRYILRDLLAQSKGIVLKEFWEVTPTK